MKAQIIKSRTSNMPIEFLPKTAPRSRNNDILTTIAVLGLIATISDGEADRREIKQFVDLFRAKFSLSAKSAIRIIGEALTRVRTQPLEPLLETSCETINDHLCSEQKLKLFDTLAEILVADGKIQESEVHFLDLIAAKLHLADALEQLLPTDA